MTPEGQRPAQCPDRVQPHSDIGVQPLEKKALSWSTIASPHVYSLKSRYGKVRIDGGMAKKLQRSQQMNKRRLIRLWCCIALGGALVFGGGLKGWSGPEAFGQTILPLHVPPADDTDKHPAIGQLDYSCTATLILRDIVLTAAH